MEVLACAAFSLAQVLLVNSFLKTKMEDSQLASNVIGLFLVQYLPLKFYRVFLYHRYFSPLRHLPGPKDNHFLFGQSIKFLQSESPVDLYIKWMKEWPDEPVIRYLGLFNKEVLVVNSPTSFKDLLQTSCYAFVKPQWWRRFTHSIIGDGLIMMEGDEHRAHRKMLSGTLSAPSVKKLEPVVREKAKEVGLLFDSAIAANDGKTGVIPADPVFSKFTLDIIAKVTLGMDLNHLGSAASTYQQSKQQESLTPSPTTKQSPPEGYTFHEAYMALFGQSAFGDFLFFVNAFLPIRWLPLQDNRRFLNGASFIGRTLLSLIRQRNEEVKRSWDAGSYEKQNSRDIKTFLVEESLPGGPAEGLRENHFLGHILQLMAGGVDTTANTLTWSAYELASHHDIQDKLRGEILDLLARVPEPTYAEIDTLPYLHGFIKEILRVYCPVIVMHRQAVQDVVLDGVPVPRGTQLDAAPLMPMTNPRIWGDDAGAVRPERWAPARLTAAQRSPYAFTAFSLGPRICIGRGLAYLEMKVVLVAMLRRYRFLRVEAPPRVHTPSLLLHAHGLEVRVERMVGAGGGGGT